MPVKPAASTMVSEGTELRIGPSENPSIPVNAKTSAMPQALSFILAMANINPNATIKGKNPMGGA